jgi:hypothetical protein
MIAAAPLSRWPRDHHLGYADPARPADPTYDICSFLPYERNLQDAADIGYARNLCVLSLRAS